MAIIDKPYTNLPNYADLEYIDGKLKVAQSIVKRTTSEETKKRWNETINIILDQRAAYLEVFGGNNR